MTLARSDELTVEELGQLDDFLDTVEPVAMNVEMIDGFFAALMCGPDLVKPSTWLPEIWGADISFQSREEAEEITGLLMRHWNVVSRGLQRTLTEPVNYAPVLEEDEDGIAHANDWAAGFMHGVQMCATAWSGLISNEKNAQLLAPMLILDHEHDDDSSLRSQIVTEDDRNMLIDTMLDSLTEIYRFFQPQRMARAADGSSTTVRRQEPKVGRNDPCPCGSGRKYKQCCGANAPTLH